jgi:hypothetical protein
MSHKQTLSQLLTPSRPFSSSQLLDKEDSLAFEPLPIYKGDDPQYNNLFSDLPKNNCNQNDHEILYDGQKVTREKINEKLNRLPKLKKKRIEETPKENEEQTATSIKKKKTKKIRKEDVIDKKKENGIVKKLNKNKKVKKGKVVNQPENLDNFLEEIENEDLKAQNQQMSSSLSEIEKSKIVALQLKLELFLYNIRMKLQPILESAKILPKAFLYQLQNKQEQEKNLALQLMILSVFDFLELEKEGNGNSLRGKIKIPFLLY